MPYSRLTVTRKRKRREDLSKAVLNCTSCNGPTDHNLDRVLDKTINKKGVERTVQTEIWECSECGTERIYGVFIEPVL